MDTAHETVMIYMTANDATEAERIGRIIVEERLAACANIIPGMKSLYWWEGKVQNGSEVVLIAKTRRDLAENLINRVKTIHSYSVPCIVVLPILAGNPEYLAWVSAETRGGGPRSSATDKPQ